jgi:hypothetical protein
MLIWLSVDNVIYEQNKVDGNEHGNGEASYIEERQQRPLSQVKGDSRMIIQYDGCAATGTTGK